jgi:hypothetical protein
MQLIGREKELDSLKEFFSTNRAELVFVFGRRRVGKTTLLMNFIETNGGIYLLSRDTTLIDNLSRFSSVISQELNDELIRVNPLSSWDAFFEYLSRLRGRVLVVLDEFPYLLKSSPDLPSILQSWWDMKLSQTQIMLVLMGSSVAMMEKLAEYKSPIYGRRTGQIKLNPFGYSEVPKFLPDYNDEENALVYGILGGMPAYLRSFDGSHSVWENLKNKYLSSSSVLYIDPIFVLRDELDEPRRYFAIMESISKGKNTISEISDTTGLPSSILSKYLGVLVDLGLVKKFLPFGMRRNGRYFIVDNYFDFWFRFIYPNADLIESGRSELVLEIIKNDLNHFMGKIYERMVREYLSRTLIDVAPLWFHDIEIDLVGKEMDGSVTVAEVKWSDLTERDVSRELEKLRNKVLDLKIGRVTKHLLFIKKMKGKHMPGVIELSEIYQRSDP